MNRASAPSPHRYRLHRAGIRNVWQYDEQEFLFGDGRLLLRGKNGAGKSKALEMLLPYLLDGDARALDATGTGRTTLLWLMLDGFEQTNRLGYLWVEFVRTDEEGTEHHLTLGAAIRASQSAKKAQPFFFTTPLRVGQDLQLASAGQPLPLDQLKSLVGSDRVTERAVEHRARVARDLFGLTDPARYRNLLHLLHRLRRPTIGDRIDSGGLVSVLAETLPSLDDEIVEKVARNLDDLDAVRGDLGRLERTDAALRTFLGSYRGYLHGALRRRADQVAAELDRLAECRRKEDGAASRAAGLRERETELDARADALHNEKEAAQADLDALLKSADYRSLEDLREKRGTLAALHSAATAAFKSLRQAHNAQQEAGSRLTEQAERLGAELRELGSTHRELRTQAERSGTDPAHLGAPVSGAAVTVSGPQDAELTAPDADLHLVRHPVVQSIDTGACVSALEAWAGQLDAAGPVIRTRLRAAAELLGLIEQSEQRRQAAHDADRLREQLDEQAEAAGEQVRDRLQDTARAGAAYAEAAAAWVDDLQDLSGVPLDEVRLLLGQGEGPPAGDVPDQVTATARTALEGHLEDLTVARDDLTPVLHELRGERDRLERERAAWEHRTDPEPTPPPHRTAPRTPGTGAPLFRLVDFAEDLDPAYRADLEAALEASGLLDAWVGADGTALDPATLDTLLTPGPPPEGATLAQALLPVEVAGSGVRVEQVERLLRSVALGGPAGADGAHSVVAADGSWRLGIVRGRHTKPVAEFVGAEVRAETRRRALADLDARLTGVRDELTARQETLEALTTRRDRITQVLHSPPPARGLTDAWAQWEQARQTEDAQRGMAAAAAREAEEARAQVVAARRAAEAAAAAHDLPSDRSALDSVRTALGRLRTDIPQLQQRIRVVAGNADALDLDRVRYERAVARRQDAESDYAEPLTRLDAARRTIRQLEESIGATEQEILAREDDARRRLETVRRQLPPIEREKQQVHDERVAAERDAQIQRDALAGQEQQTIGSGQDLRAVLTLPGVTRGAGLDGHEELTHPDPAHDDVRSRIQAVQQLIKAVRGHLDAERRDVSDTALLNRHTELRDQLSGGYDASLEEPGGLGIKLCRLIDDHGPSDIAVVGERIAAQAADARERLTEREREVFQRFLTGELGDHLSTQVLSADALVAALNDTLRTVRTSHGLGVELDWKLTDSAEADVRAAVELLRSPSGLRTREQSEQLRDVLQRRIEDARRGDPAAGYAAHLRTALDYREWFTFTPWVVDDAAPRSRRKLSGRTGLSQGEQRVLSYLVLFAAAAAHFTSLAEAAPHAPRLILLDDAFAKVDEPTHGRLGRILVDLDLDFVLTSERLIGNWSEVPSLHIYECLRDPHVRGVATLHYTWNGRHRRLMSV